jgi:hypothetical protein
LIKPSIQIERSVLLISAVWFIAASGAIFMGFTDGDILCDDGFYYFEIARNAALGNNFTFDTLGATNGFHPLWAWLLVPIFSLGSDSIWGPIRCAQVLSALFTLGTAFCIHGIFSRKKLHGAAQIGAILWLFNPFTWLLSFRGLESALNVFLIAMSFMFLARIRENRQYARTDAALMGVLMGLCLLARTDNILWLFCVVIIICFDLVSLRRGRDILNRGFIFGGFAFGVIAPWVAWNMATFGTIVQTSFRAKKMFTLYGQLPHWPPNVDFGFDYILLAFKGILTNLYLIFEHVSKYILQEEWVPINQSRIFLWIFIGVTGFFCIAAWVQMVKSKAGYLHAGTRQSKGMYLLPLYLFSVTHLVWYGLISESYFNWYFLPMVLVWVLFAAKQLDAMRTSTWKALRLLQYALIAGCLLATPWIASLHVPEERPYHLDETHFKQRHGRLLAQLPEGTQAGLWNAGTTGYFASHYYPNHIVINLDGVVNNVVTSSDAPGFYEDYILDHVDVLLEDPRFMSYIVGSERQFKFQQNHLDDQFRVVKRERTSP